MWLARILVGWLAAVAMLAGMAASPAGVAAAAGSARAGAGSGGAGAGSGGAGSGGAAGAYQSVLRVYERDGSVPACQFSGGELERALGGVDTYGAQYFADFTEAIQTALSAAASGECARPAAGSVAGSHGSGAAGGSGGSGGSGASGGSGGSGGPPARFGPVTAATSAGVPAPLLAMGILAVAVALFSGVWQLDRRRSRT